MVPVITHRPPMVMAISVTLITLQRQAIIPILVRSIEDKNKYHDWELTG